MEREYIDSDYRDSIGAVIFNKHGKVFVGQRIKNDIFNWQFPQGGIEPNEIVLDALFREILEEIGTNKINAIYVLEEWLYYDLPENIIPNFFNGKYKGQRQKWHLVYFTGEDSDININTECPEFRDWKWCDIDWVLGDCVDFKYDVYKVIIDKFKPKIQGYINGKK